MYAMKPRFKFQTKLLVALAVNLLVVGALAVVSWHEARESQKTAQLVARAHEVLDQLAETKAGSLLIELSTQNYRLTGDTGHLAERDAAILAREIALRRVTELTADDPSQQENRALLRATADEGLSISRRIELLRTAEGAVAANVYAAGAPLRETQERLLGMLREMDEEQRRLLGQREGEQSRVREIRNALGAISTLLLATLLATSYFLIRRQF